MPINLESPIFQRLGQYVSNNRECEQQTGDDASYHAFLKQFPANELANLTLESYCLGSGSAQNNFCWWLERGLEKPLGRYSPGSSRGHLIYKQNDGTYYLTKKLQTLGPDEAMRQVAKLHAEIAKHGIGDIDWIDNDKEIAKRAGVNPNIAMGDGRKLRLLAIYNIGALPPISSVNHIGWFLNKLGLSESEIADHKRPIARIKQLKRCYEQARQQFNEKLTPYGFMKALYSEELGIRPQNEDDYDPDSDPEYRLVLDCDTDTALNQILYGPPGTGKTFTTNALAVKAADPVWYADAYDGSEWGDFNRAVKTKYDELVGQGRIVFTTFHQSFAYEDFVEGIRARPSESGDGLVYDVEDGVFKSLADKASKAVSASRDLGLSESPRVWKISIARTHEQDIRNHYLSRGEARIGWNSTGDLSVDIDERTESEQDYWKARSEKNKRVLNGFAEEMQIGDVLLCLKDASTIQAVGIVSSNYIYDPDMGGLSEGYVHCRKVNWLLKDINFNILPINNDTRLVQQTLYPLKRISWEDVSTELTQQGYKLQANNQPQNSTDKPNYVIVIDEINRGNISRVFGELITLLEPDKRKGGDDARSVTLPYSKELFSVPSNLYVIGTMNTADKSLAQLDIALRRRFEFVEMLPKPEILADISIHNTNISHLLKIINNRIEVLLDRDHLIGHSYFMPLLQAGNNKPEMLADIFRNKIIPLLQEYFFSDWEKIAWVLNDIDKPKEAQFIQLAQEDADLGRLFSTKVSAELSDRRYNINQAAFDMADAYQGILGNFGE